MSQEMLRTFIIRKVLSHIANGYLVRGCKASSSDARAADWLRRSVSGGAYSHEWGWTAERSGVAYAGPAHRVPRSEHGCDVIPWIEIARVARTGAEQPTLDIEVSA